MTNRLTVGRVNKSLLRKNIYMGLTTHLRWDFSLFLVNILFVYDRTFAVPLNDSR